MRPRLHSLLSFTAAAWFAAGILPAMAQRRDSVVATGSSTVAPFTRAVADMLAEGGAKPLDVRSVGTVTGYAEFCRGAGLRYPDIQNALAA